MFVLSKLLSAITQPMFWLALWWGIALLLLNRRPRAAQRMLWSGLGVLGLLGFVAIPDALLRPLENRYPVPPENTFGQYAGVIVLGGAPEHPRSYTAHGQVPFNDAAERMTVPLPWMRQHPKLELIYSGGEGRLITAGITESELARQFYTEQGLDMSRVTLETSSRTTRENAQLVAKLLGQRCQEPWLLLTSAWHMPRSMTEFQQQGCNVTAYPVDFRTGKSTPLTEYSLAYSLLRWQTALHEWVGKLAYSLTDGRK